MEADFPSELDQLSSLLERVEEYHATRQRLSAEMADHSGVIRTLVVRAEDARLMSDMLVNQIYLCFHLFILHIHLLFIAVTVLIAVLRAKSTCQKESPLLTIHIIAEILFCLSFSFYYSKTLASQFNGLFFCIHSFNLNIN